MLPTPPLPSPLFASLCFQSKGTSHKRLQWTHVLGNAVVKATFGKHSYDLQVHTLQAIALMEFNATKGEVHTRTLIYTPIHMQVHHIPTAQLTHKRVNTFVDFIFRSFYHFDTGGCTTVSNFNIKITHNLFLYLHDSFNTFAFFRETLCSTFFFTSKYAFVFQQSSSGASGEGAKSFASLFESLQLPEEVRHFSCAVHENGLPVMYLFVWPSISPPACFIFFNCWPISTYTLACIGRRYLPSDKFYCRFHHLPTCFPDADSKESAPLSLLRKV